MGIAVVPVDPIPSDPQEPCYDSDCYYAGGEYLTWWPGTPPVQPLPREEPVMPGPIETPPTIEPPPIVANIPQNNESPPPSTSPSPPPPTTSPPSTPSPETPTPQPSPGTGDNPLYSVIGTLLQSRPDKTEGTPLVITQAPPSPTPVLIVAVLAIAGVVAYAYFRR